MTAAKCTRLWLAEAVEDGRVGEVERLAFRQHALGCAECHHEVAELARLREVARLIPEPPTVSDFDHHRQRALLVERAGARVFGPRRRLRPSLVLGGVVAMALAGGAWALKVGIRGSERAAVEPYRASPSSPPKYEVTSLQAGTWSQEENGGSTRVTLKTGSAEFHVHPLTRDQRFLVSIPDGEIEVVGTRFVVAIRGERTQYVVVTEGKVWLRQYGQPQRLLVPGTRWDRPADEAAAGTSTTAKPAAPASPSDQASRAAASVASDRRGGSAALPGDVAWPTRRTRGAIAVVGSPQHEAPASSASRPARTPTEPTSNPRPKSSSATRSETAPDSLFARGISAFRAGRYDEAEALWRAFLADQPSDARTEDAAFLRAVARTRLGDTAGAAALAREYLRRFPRGLRRQEAASLSGEAP